MRARSLLALCGFAAAASLAPLPAGAVRICADAVPVEMVDKVASSTARSGGPFRFKTTDDVELPDGTKIPAGTLGYGVIRAADPAARHAHDGMLSIEPRYLVVPKDKGGVKRVDVTMNPTLPVVWAPTEPLLNKAISKVPLPVPGLAMQAVNTVRWGKNVTLGPGFVFSVIPIDNLAHGPIC